LREGVVRFGVAIGCRAFAAFFRSFTACSTFFLYARRAFSAALRAARAAFEASFAAFFACLTFFFASRALAFSRFAWSTASLTSRSAARCRSMDNCGDWVPLFLLIESERLSHRPV
jgi:hypothetical protein